MFGLIASLAAPIIGLIDKAIPDKDEANRVKAEIQRLILEGEGKEIEAKARIILAEAQGNWLQRNWRPMLMLSIMGIVVNNYILFPYLHLWTDKVVVLELPGGLWALLTTGVGGYVVGRSVEKSVDKYKNG